MHCGLAGYRGGVNGCASVGGVYSGLSVCAGGGRDCGSLHFGSFGDISVNFNEVKEMNYKEGIIEMVSGVGDEHALKVMWSFIKSYTEEINKKDPKGVGHQ